MRVTLQLAAILAALILLEGGAGAMLMHQARATQAAQEESLLEALAVVGSCQRLSSYANQEVAEILGYVKGSVGLERIDRTRFQFKAEADNLSARLDAYTGGPNETIAGGLRNLTALEASLFEVKEEGSNETLLTLREKTLSSRAAILGANEAQRETLISFMLAFQESALSDARHNQTMVRILADLEREREVVLTFSPIPDDAAATAAQIERAYALNDALVRDISSAGTARIDEIRDDVQKLDFADPARRDEVEAVAQNLTTLGLVLGNTTGATKRAETQTLFENLGRNLSRAESLGVRLERRDVAGVGASVTSFAVWAKMITQEQQLRRNLAVFLSTATEMETVVHASLLPQIELLRSETSLLTNAIIADAQLRSRQALDEGNARTHKLIGVAIAGVVLPVAALGMLAARKLHRRIRSFDAAAAEVAKGNFESPPPPPLQDDFDSLAAAWARMKEGLVQRDRHLAAQTEVLRQSERMASLGGLLAGVAHEINNPLTFIKGNEETTLEDIDHLLTFERIQQDDDVRPVLEMIREGIVVNLDGISRIEATNRALKGFASPSRASRTPVDLNEVVDGALIIAHNRLKTSFRVERAFSQLPKVAASPQELGQIILNLIMNAADAAPKGTVIRVSTDVEDERVVVRVQDQGPGVPKDLHASLFKPFVTTKEHGTGIGLHISRGIAETYGGTLCLEDSSEGACFALSIPVRPPETSAGDSPAVITITPKEIHHVPRADH